MQLWDGSSVENITRKRLIVDQLTMKNKTQRVARAADIHRMYANVHKGKHFWCLHARVSKETQKGSSKSSYFDSTLNHFALKVNCVDSCCCCCSLTSTATRSDVNDCNHKL